MSGKLFNPLQDPPNASSSDEEDEEVEETVGNSSEEEEEEEEEEDVSSKNQTVKTPQPEKKQVSESEPDSGSDEETDSEPETERKEPVKKNQDSKKVEPLVTKKRSSETDASKDAKRVKTVSGEETRKNYFQRLWSEEDEIALLQGIIDYNRETGASPYDDKHVFYERVKKDISFDVSKTQFMEKIRSLKKKFENNLGKGKKKNGEDPAFAKPHDRKAFDLSKLIWGDNGILAVESSSAVKSNGKSKKKRKDVECKEEEEELVYSKAKAKVESVVVKKQEFVSIVESVARFGVDELAAKQGWAKLSEEDKKRFEEQWKVLQIKEFKFYSQKSGFIHEVVTKMAEAFRPKP